MLYRFKIKIHEAAIIKFNIISKSKSMKLKQTEFVQLKIQIQFEEMYNNHSLLQ